MLLKTFSAEIKKAAKNDVEALDENSRVSCADHADHVHCLDGL